MSTSPQPAVVSPPSSHAYTSFSVSEFCCWTNTCAAVRNAATVTPARISVAVVRAPPTERPIRYAATTAAIPPANDASGRTKPSTPAGPYAITSVAPKPAPAATPSRYGSASGFRKTPW